MPRSRYDLVQPPAVPDPLQTLSGMMSIAGQMQGFQDQSKEVARQKRVEGAFNTAKGDHDAAASLLEQQGEYASAKSLRATGKEIRDKQLSDVIGRLNQHKTLLGQSGEILTQIEKAPTLYPELRPRLVEIAGQIAPELAEAIPADYDAERVRGMVEFAQATQSAAEKRARAAQKLKEKQTAKESLVKNIETDRAIVADWFSVSNSQDDWDNSIATAKRYGVADEILSQIGPTWSTAAMERARMLGMDPKDRKPAAAPTTFAAAILAAREKGDTAAVDGLLKLQGRVRSAGRAPETEVTADMLAAVQKNPQLWGMLTPGIRDKMLAPLSKSGFDFSQAATGMTEAQLAGAERWRMDALARLERDKNDPLADMSTQEYRRRQDDIERSYLTQIGKAALPTPGGNGVGLTPGLAERQVPSGTGVPPKASPKTGADTSVLLRLPDGRTVRFPTQAAADAFAKDAGFTIAAQ